MQILTSAKGHRSPPEIPGAGYDFLCLHYTSETAQQDCLII